MSGTFPNASAQSDDVHAVRGNSPVSLSAAEATVAGDFAFSFPPAAARREEGITLPGFLHPSTGVTSLTSSAPSRPVGTQTMPPSSNDSAQSNGQPAKQLPRHSLHLREEQEAVSLFNSHNRTQEMSSFGISVSTATAAGGWSASTIPTRWLKSAEVRPLATGSDAITARRNPASVFERWEQVEVAHTERGDAAMLMAAAYMSDF